MTPEEKELLTQVAKLGEENHKILIGLQRSMRLQTIWSVIKIAVVVVPLVAGYIFIQPYLNNILGGSSIGSSLQNLPENLKGVSDLLKGQ